VGAENAIHRSELHIPDFIADATEWAIRVELNGTVPVTAGEVPMASSRSKPHPTTGSSESL